MSHFEVLGFVDIDLLFLITGISCGGLGAVMDYVYKRNDFKNLSVNIVPQVKWRAYVPLFFGRVVIGCFSGLIIWLILYDILQHNSESYVRLALVSLMAGFSTPALLKSYQDKAAKIINEETNKNN
jgi:hypothetical protein